MVRVEQERTLLQGFFQITEAVLRYERYDRRRSEPVRRLKLERGDSVAVLVRHVDRDQILLIEQFKYPTYGRGDGWIVETVAGVVDEGESAEEAARRETREEIGYDLLPLEPIATLETAKAKQRPQPLRQTERLIYKLDKSRERIGLVTGDLAKVRFADIWVNTENTRMQMSRIDEPTISATVRYQGAEIDEFGAVVKDCIADEFSDQMKGKMSVDPARILVTGPGALARSHGVMRVFHAAAVQGSHARGTSRSRTSNGASRRPWRRRRTSAGTTSRPARSSSPSWAPVSVVATWSRPAGGC
jgi:8-oxo-dGTP pyrophosphatase MutT (NUDIX family)